MVFSRGGKDHNCRVECRAVHPIGGDSIVVCQPDWVWVHGLVAATTLDLGRVSLVVFWNTAYCRECLWSCLAYVQFKFLMIKVVVS